MGVWTRILLTVIVVSIPASGAFAADKYNHVLYKSSKTATEATAPAPPEKCLDMTSADQLRAARFDDLSPGQLNTLDREVTRIRALRGKAESDGQLTDAEKERIAQQTIRSCQKIMTPWQVTQAGKTERATRFNGSNSQGRTRR